jgi:peptidoglycan-associated lipoprotein
MMSVLRHVRWSFLAVFTLTLVVALSSCSKKDVKQDEPIINPSGDSGAASPSTGNAGSSADTGENSQLQTVYFDFDSFKLRGDARATLKSNADYLKANPNITVQIEGHCDERGTTEYNLALGERRADATRNYLTKMGIAKSRVSVISYGKERPADAGHDESAWAKNRRSSFVVLSPNTKKESTTFVASKKP